MEKKVVEKIAHLARLKLSDDEEVQYRDHFGKIIQYFKSLEKLDTQGIEPMITPHAVAPALREDKVHQTLTVEEILQNAPDVKDALFKVPPVV